MRTELNISDEDIREMLRPLTALERSGYAIQILQALNKYGELPGCVIGKIFKNENVSSPSHPPMRPLMDEGYVTRRKGVHRGIVSNFFKITPKGQAALRKKCDS